MTSDRRAAIPAEIVGQRIATLTGWAYRDNALVRQFEFGSFTDAVAFVVRLAFEAEAADHHPDLDVRYRRVLVRWSTHSAGGVTEMDFAGVAQSDEIGSRLAR